MSWVGGAASWHSRRGSPEPESDVADSYESPDEEPVAEDNEAPAMQGGGREAQSTHAADRSHEDHEPVPFSMSTDEYEMVQSIYMPSNEVKKKTGQLLLSSHGPGQYRLYKGVDLDEPLLELAGHLPAPTSAMERVQLAERLTERACASRCGDKCSGACRVRAFVDAGDHGTDFFFGSRDDIDLSLLTCGACCDVYIWDELEHRSIKSLNRRLDALLDTWPGLAMRRTELKTVPGEVGAGGCSNIISPAASVGMPPTPLGSPCA